MMLSKDLYAAKKKRMNAQTLTAIVSYAISMSYGTSPVRVGEMCQFITNHASSGVSRERVQAELNRLTRDSIIKRVDVPTKGGRPAYGWKATLRTSQMMLAYAPHLPPKLAEIATSEFQSTIDAAKTAMNKIEYINSEGFDVASS